MVPLDEIDFLRLHIVKKHAEGDIIILEKDETKPTLRRRC